MTPKTENLFERIERSHQNLLTRIDELDLKVAEVLKNWTDPASVVSMEPFGEPSEPVKQAEHPEKP